MKIPTVQYLSLEGKLSPKCKHSISPETLIKGYETMQVMRLVEDRMITLQRQGAISFALCGFGEEAAVVASAAALSQEDWIYPQYRESGVMFWRGYPIVNFIHHMFGNAKDSILGRQMPNHFGSRELNVVTVSSPIGTKIPHAAGCAYAMKLQKQKNIVICYFGEGASSEGDFHTGINFAAVKKVPAIFFCRNNGFAISTPSAEQFASDGITPKGIGYGIEAIRVDGNDFFAIHEAVTQAKQLCLKEKGPVLIEAITYRMGSHSTSDDPTRYRKESELIEWKKKDPILRLKKYLENQKLWNEKKENTLIEKIKKEIQEAIDEAKNTPPPAIESLIQDVYFQIPNTLREQLEELKEMLS